MAFSNIDRTTEVKSGGCFAVMSTDFCYFYKKHPDTFLQRRECWTCCYAEFGIDTGYPTDTGVCKFNQN